MWWKIRNEIRGLIMENLTVNILGTEYKIYFRNEKDDVLLDGKGRDGYTDMSAHEIIVCNKKDDCELRDYEEKHSTS